MPSGIGAQASRSAASGGARRVETCRDTGGARRVETCRDTSHAETCGPHVSDAAVCCRGDPVWSPEA